MENHHFWMGKSTINGHCHVAMLAITGSDFPHPRSKLDGLQVEFIHLFRWKMALKLFRISTGHGLKMIKMATRWHYLTLMLGTWLSWFFKTDVNYGSSMGAILWSVRKIIPRILANSSFCCWLYIPFYFHYISIQISFVFHSYSINIPFISLICSWFYSII